ncbi:MAG: hypothetical protein ACI3XN_05500 [Eubacteriales bacterium]
MGKGKIIAGFVLGIIGIVFGILSGYFSIVGLPVAIVGLVLSVIGMKQEKASRGSFGGLGIAALVIGIVAVVFTTIAFFTCGLCIICASGTASSILHSLK